MILVWLGSSHMQNRFIKSLNALRDIDTAERNLVAHKDNGVSFFRKKWKKKVKKNSNHVTGWQNKHLLEFWKW